MFEVERLEFSNSLRVYCIIIVIFSYVSLWVVVKEIWIRYCDKVEFFSIEYVIGLELIIVNENSILLMTIKVCTYVFEKYRD